jgi:hypothetical protein
MNRVFHDHFWPRRALKAVRSRRSAVLALHLSLAACGAHSSVDRHDASPVIGTWLVTIPEAPFPLHMFAFHSDGTVQQSNPDAGDPNSSDSAAMGVWREDGNGVKGRLVEITADRITRQFVSRGEISFSVKVAGNALSGTATAVFYDASGQRVRGPVPATLAGRRVLP